MTEQMVFRCMFCGLEGDAPRCLLKQVVAQRDGLLATAKAVCETVKPPFFDPEPGDMQRYEAAMSKLWQLVAETSIGGDS
jgi:hypothetical protein